MSATNPAGMRELADEVEQIHFGDKPVRAATTALRAAADEADRLGEARDTWKRLAYDEHAAGSRLRSVIKSAPHNEDCGYRVTRELGARNPADCDCWKADAL